MNVRSIGQSLIATFLMACPFGTDTYGQTPGYVTDGSSLLWVVPQVNLRLAEEWRVISDFNWRRVLPGLDAQQDLFRAGLERRHGGMSIAAGYAFAASHRYGPFPALSAFNEHRAWEQVAHERTHGPWTIEHRYRLEQRWIEAFIMVEGEIVADDVAYRNRIRYRLQVRYTFLDELREPAPWSLTLSNEIFLHFLNGTQGNTFDQDRIAMYVARKISSTFTARVGALEQIIVRAGYTEINTAVTLGLVIDLDFSSRED